MIVVGRTGPLDPAILDGAVWQKSSRSEGAGGNCVEAAPLADGSVAVRHSQQPDATAIVYTPAEWQAFLAGAKSGEFDF